MKNIIRFLSLLSFAAISALTVVGCGGGGGGGGGSSSGGGGGNTDTGFTAPDTTTWAGQTIAFTFDASNVITLILGGVDGEILNDQNSSDQWQVFYSSGKFGGNADSKTGNFQLIEVSGLNPSAAEYSLDLIWTSVSAATFTGLLYPDNFDKLVSSASSGSADLLEIVN